MIKVLICFNKYMLVQCIPLENKSSPVIFIQSLYLIRKLYSNVFLKCSSLLIPRIWKLPLLSTLSAIKRNCVLSGGNKLASLLPEYEL